MRDARHRKPVQHGPRCRWDGGVRPAPFIRYVVIHDAEAPSDAAQGVANYGAKTSTKVSWHAVCDDERLIRCLPDLVIAWAAPGANGNGLQLELCGYARYSKLQWYVHQATLKRGAWQVAKWCEAYKIPPRWLSDEELAAGERKGLVTHAQVSRVFRRSTHSDPGPSFPARFFLFLVKRRIEWL